MKSRNTWGTNFIPRNKSRVQKNKKLASMEQITTTGGTKMLGRRTNKDYMGNIILVQILTTNKEYKFIFHGRNHDYGVN
jgi:hypothetical protein